jgi:RimJ/RimL family protein N-acetyltransferase
VGTTTHTLEQNADMADSPIGTPLPEHVLARRGQLPLKVAPATLTGPRVQLIPLDLGRDLDALQAVSNGQPARLGERAIGAYDPDERIWRYTCAHSGPFPDAAALATYLRPLVDNPTGLCLCVFHRATGQQVGVTNFLNNAPEHLRVELGSIWYSPLVQGTGANTEATYLMLRHAFGLGYRRVEWKCNVRNTRSYRAAVRMGFTSEGTREAYAIAKGCNRDSAWFCILDTEWPTVAANLQHLLEFQAAMEEPV